MTGLTDVEKCEKNPQKSYLSNVKIVENICNSILLIKKDCYFVHISTDHVYDGIGPHTEKDINLKNYYAFSKYASELVALKGNSIVLRTNFFGKSFKNRGLTDWLYYSLRNKSKIKVFNDVLFVLLWEFSRILFHTLFFLFLVIVWLRFHRSLPEARQAPILAHASMAIAASGIIGI